MELCTQTYYTLKQKVTHAFEHHEHTLLPGGSSHSRGRPLALPIIDILTLGVFWKTYDIETKKGLFNLFTLSCSYKTLVCSLNRFGLLILLLCIRLAEENRKHPHLVKYTDSTDLPVCLVKNATHHQTMRGLAVWAKTRKGWFFGLKLHLTVDADCRILSFSFTPGNVDDRAQFMRLNNLLKGIFVADAGYISEELAKRFYQEGVRILFTKPRANMKKLATAAQNALYDSRARIEGVFRNLKLFDGLVSSLSRSVNGYFANYFYALAARMLA